VTKAPVTKANRAPVVTRAGALALYRHLEQDGTLMEVLRDGTRVFRTTKKPFAVIINGFGYELAGNKLRFFRSVRGQRLDLKNPERQMATFAAAFLRVCRAYGLAETPKQSTPKSAAALRKARGLQRSAKQLLPDLLVGVPQRKASAIAARINHSILEPEAYVSRHRAELAERGIHDARNDLHVYALVDALLGVGVVGEVDWRSDPQEVKRATDRPLRRHGISVAAVWPQDVEGRPRALLRDLGKRLLPLRKQLMLIDLRNDAHDFVIVDARRSRRIAYRFRSFGATLVAA
jgi:hypothetical protein